MSSISSASASASGSSGNLNLLLQASAVVEKTEKAAQFAAAALKRKREKTADQNAAAGTPSEVKKFKAKPVQATALEVHEDCLHCEKSWNHYAKLDKLALMREHEKRQASQDPLDIAFCNTKVQMYFPPQAKGEGGFLLSMDHCPKVKDLKAYFKTDPRVWLDTTWLRMNAKNGPEKFTVRALIKTLNGQATLAVVATIEASRAASSTTAASSSITATQMSPETFTASSAAVNLTGPSAFSIYTRPSTSNSETVIRLPQMPPETSTAGSEPSGETAASASSVYAPSTSTSQNAAMMQQMSPPLSAGAMVPSIAMSAPTDLASLSWILNMLLTGVQQGKITGTQLHSVQPQLLQIAEFLGNPIAPLIRQYQSQAAALDFFARASAAHVPFMTATSLPTYIAPPVTAAATAPSLEQMASSAGASTATTGGEATQPNTMLPAFQNGFFPPPGL